jgi:tagaturonate epimerase
MDTNNIPANVSNKLKEDYFIYKGSFHEYGEVIFFLCNNSSKRLFGEIRYDKDFILKESLKNIIEFEFDDKPLYIGLFDTLKDNAKKIIPFFPYLYPKKINKKSSFGFGDRIGNTSGIHSNFAASYNIFPLFAQQSVREITKTSKKVEDILHDAVLGVFQSGFKNDWGADADHVRDKKWLTNMINNNYLPYSMFTIDTFDYINLKPDSSGNCPENDKDFKERMVKAKKYIGRKIKFLDWEFTYGEDELLEIVRKYYKCLDHLKDCFSLIKEKISEFDFEPTFDETDIVTKPEEHFFLASELTGDGVDFSTFALRFPGVFEKSVDFYGNESELESSIKVHNEIAKHFGSYKLSLHSADYKFKVFKLFRNIAYDDFHMKLGGSSWREAVHTIAEIDKDLFRMILNISLEKAEENSIAYHMKMDTDKISKLINTKDLSGLFEIKEVVQLLEISYGTILERYRNIIEDMLMKNEDRYEENIADNYRLHFNKIFF